MALRPSKSPYGIHFFHADVAVRLDVFLTVHHELTIY